MPRDRGMMDHAKRKKQTAKNKRPAENDSVGESSTRPASMGKRMRAPATQAAAARAYLDSRFGPDLLDPGVTMIAAGAACLLLR